MKKTILFSILFTVCLIPSSYSQETLKTKYFVKDSIEFLETELKIDKKGLKSPVTVSKYLKLQNKTNGSQIDTIILDKMNSDEGLKCSVVFGEKEEDNLIFVNPYLFENRYEGRDTIYFFELENRQTISIEFTENTLTALSLPLKVRFGNAPPEFSTGANLGALLGRTKGIHKFSYRKKTGNKEYIQKTTKGLFLGVDKLEFKFKDEADKEVTVKTALISVGLGYLYAYQKFTVGLAAGFDFGLGDNVSEWDYHSRPFISIAVGYSLFNL